MSNHLHTSVPRANMATMTVLDTGIINPAKGSVSMVQWQNQKPTRIQPKRRTNKQFTHQWTPVPLVFRNGGRVTEERHTNGLVKCLRIKRLDKDGLDKRTKGGKVYWNRDDN